MNLRRLITTLIDYVDNMRHEIKVRIVRRDRYGTVTHSCEVPVAYIRISGAIAIEESAIKMEED